MAELIPIHVLLQHYSNAIFLDLLTLDIQYNSSLEEAA